MEDSTYQEALRLLRRVLDNKAEAGDDIRMTDVARAAGYQPDQVRSMMSRYEDFPITPRLEGNTYVLTQEEYRELTKYLSMRDGEVPTTNVARKYGLDLDEIFRLCKIVGLPLPHQRPVVGRDPTKRGQGRRWYWHGHEYGKVERAFEKALSAKGGD